MAKSRQAGKLAVILHADIADSTALVQQDEYLAHERIQATFRSFGNVIARYHGRTKELRGDALLAEFDRASDAVTAALAFQAEQADRNSRLNDPVRPIVRVGISMGEVVLANRTITGAGVVLAQRMEQLAEPGGLCITGAIRESLPQRLPFTCDSLGPKQVKGFEEPVLAYTVRLREGAQLPEPTSTSAQKETKTAVWTAVTIALLVGTGLLVWFVSRAPEIAPGAGQVGSPLPDKPSIAVLPFTNMSGSVEQEYFVDGITEDLITDLSKLSGLFVIARNSVFQYKGRSENVNQIGEDLGVRYILEGSVRRVRDQVRINAQLIDATTNGHLWAERYDGVLDDVFALQDEITARIVSELSVHLTATEETERSRRQTNNPLAYEAFLRGLEHYRRNTIDHYVKAMEYLEQATKLDSDYSRAYAVMASIYWKSFRDEFYQVFHVEYAVARERAQQFLELAKHKPTSLAYQASSEINLWWHRHDEAVRDAEKAVALDPNNPGGLAALARALVFSGQVAGVLELLDRAEKLDPLGKASYEFLRGLAYFGMGRFDAAVSSLERARELNPKDWAADDPENACPPCEALISSYGHLGQKEEAAPVLAYVTSFWPAFHIQSVTAYWPYRTDKDMERFTDGLRKAGVPE